jgi:hypothetical protein
MLTKHRGISNSDDVIDSRDVIARIEELEAIEGIEEQIGALEQSEEATELIALRELQIEAEDYAPDWQYGATLIRDSYFVEYAEELCKDIGEIPSDFPWYIEIDWEKTAKHIQVDYTSVEFDGVTYWVR